MPNTEVKRVHVAVGVIERGDDILLALRPKGSHMGGLWEFPGGKVDKGETVQTALARELYEELGIVAKVFEPLIEIQHDYEDKSVSLDVWRVLGFSGTAEGKEGQEVRWVRRSELPQYDFPEANSAIVETLLAAV